MSWNYTGYHYASLANNNLMGTEPSVHSNYPFAASVGNSNLNIGILIDLQNDYKISDLQAIVVYNRQADNANGDRIQGFKPQLLDSNMNIVYDGRSFTGRNTYHRVNGPAWSSVSSSLLTDNENDFATKIINRNNDSNLLYNTTIYYFYEFPEVALTSANDNGYIVTVSSTHSDGADYKAFNKSYAPASDDYWMADPYSTGTYAGGDGNYNGSTSLGGVPGEWIALQIPTPKVITGVHITARDLLVDNAGSWDERKKAPKDFKILGSNDGINWDEVLSVTGANIQDITNGGGSKFDVHTTNVAYNRFALVVQAVNEVNGDQGVHLAVSEIRYITENFDKNLGMLSTNNITTPDSSYVSTVLPGSKVEYIPMDMELGYTNDWTIEWEHMDTATSSFNQYVANGDDGRMNVRVNSDGTYRVSLAQNEDRIDLPSETVSYTHLTLPTTPYV